MDPATLTALTLALAQSPANLQLRMIVVRAHFEQGDARQAELYLGDAERDEELAPEHRTLIARVLLACGRAERALLVAKGDGENAMWRVRSLLALGRKHEAHILYKESVRENAALEDRDLAALLGSRETEVTRGAVPLRVISNDDTDRSEVSRLLEPEQTKVTFGSVGGLADIKKQIHKRIILPFQKPSLFQRYKKRVGGGILLYGPPGCGKTLLARATAGECNAAFFNVAISDILDMYIGESERKLHALFEKARGSTPAVLFFDELEALAGKRQFTREATSSKLVSQFLSEMDGFSQENHGVLVLGATNVPWAVDAAFRRPGRFDRMLFVPPPDQVARETILHLLLDGRPLSTKIDFAGIAKRTSSFSGADLEHLVESASDAAIEESLARGEELPIAQDHLLAALREVKATTTEWLTTARNYARYANEGGAYDDVLAFLKQHGVGSRLWSSDAGRRAQRRMAGAVSLFLGRACAISQAAAA